jgi:hypothetical protein
VVLKHVVRERPLVGRTVTSGMASMLAGLLAATAQGDPLPTRNENPLLAPYGLPNTLPSRLPAHGSGSIAGVLNWANSIAIDDTSASSFILDGESQEWRLEIEHGVTDKFAVRVELPWRRLSGGSLDSVVEQWHSLWNLPNGHRNTVPRDQLLIDYAENNLSLLHVDDSSSGIGDIPVALGYQVMATGQRALADLRTGGCRLAGQRRVAPRAAAGLRVVRARGRDVERLARTRPDRADRCEFTGVRFLRHAPRGRRCRLQLRR